MTRTSSRSNFQRLLPALLLLSVVAPSLALFAFPLRVDAATVILTSGTSWTVPSDWNDGDNSIQAVGGGATGQTATFTVGGYGGGGGAYAVKSNIALTPGASISYQIGGASQDTWFKSTGDVLAKGASGQTGGQAASCVPSTGAHNGGNGGSGASYYGGGGGGAGGPSSDGGAGTTNAGQNNPGGAGGGTISAGYDAGAGGNSSASGQAGLPGNNYGGGGGGGAASSYPGGTGAQGIIVITYTAAAVAPTVTTNSASAPTPTAATLFGSITNTGGADATQYGFAYGTDSTLATVIATTTLGSFTGTGSFSGSIASLSADTTYYYRAYATNSAGTGYGSILSFTTGNSTPARKLRIFEGFKLKLISGKMILRQQ